MNLLAGVTSQMVNKRSLVWGLKLQSDLIITQR